MRIRFLLALPIMAGMLVLSLSASSPIAARQRPGHQAVSRTDEEIAAQEKLRDERYLLDKGLDTLGIRPGMIVAEIGAGEGYLVLKLARRVGPDGKVLAEDVAARFLGTLKRRAAARGLANIETVVGETADPRLPRDAFDMIFMHTTFHFIEEPAGFFGTLHPALKPDGKIVVIEPEGDTFVDPAGQPVKGFPSRQDYLDVFERAGLWVVDIDDRTMPHYTIFILSTPKTSAGSFKSGRIRLAAEARVSDDRLPEGVLFQNPRCLAVDAEGHVYVSDFDANHIKVFGPDGAFRAVLGRAGQGPGDLGGPSLLAVSDGRLVVWEAMNRRFSVLGLDGRFIKTAPAVHGGMGELLALRALPDGRFIALIERGLPDGFQGRLPDERDTAVLLLSSDLAPVSSVIERKIRNRAWTRHPQTQGLIQVGFPYHPNLRADVSPGGTIAAGTAEAYEIELLDPDQGRRAVIKRPFQPVKLEDRDKEAHFGRFRMSVFVNGQRSVVFKAPDYVRQLTEFPAILPPYRGMVFDGRGRLWIQVFTAERADNIFDVFSPAGEYLNRVTLEGAAIDAGFTSPFEKVWVGDFLWRIEKDEDGYASLTKYRLTPMR